MRISTLTENTTVSQLSSQKKEKMNTLHNARHLQNPLDEFVTIHPGLNILDDFLNSDFIYKMNLHSREEFHSIHGNKSVIYDTAGHPVYGKGGQQAVSDRRRLRIPKPHYRDQ